ncbi:glycosyl hydrolase [Pedobacter ureilyticus]|uniref:Glycosyl hydrolase n=1 Tax=Pedobacter ureilyticus TaxID=1393051 RepID=A0ABW9J9N6_9SPHI|nr:glycosyl hydrolase [Pedobacter helvus]
MKRNLLFFLLALLCLVHLKLAAQVPNLPVKATLSTPLNGQKTFNNPSQREILTLPFNPTGDYSLEVKAKVNSVVGRGLDVDTRSAGGMGFRTSLDGNGLSFTSPLNIPLTLSASNNTEEQTFRYAIKGNTVHIYQNGAHIASRALVASKDVDDTNVEVDPVVVKGPNLMGNWSNTTGLPTAAGWVATGNTGTVNWNTLNSTSGVRFLDVSATSTNKFTYNAANYTGRVFFIRWDSNDYNNATFSFPVTLEANKSYDFSFLQSYWSNAQNGSRNITVGVSKRNDGTDIISSKIFYPAATQGELNHGNFLFTVTDAGQYYITFKGSWALYGISALSLNSLTITPQLLVGKNYLNGAVDMEISSVFYEDGAYAPAAYTPNTRKAVQLTGNIVNLPVSFDTDFIVPGKTDVHFTGDPTPMLNSSIALNSNDAWLFLDHIKPSVVVSNWLDKITINGAAVANNVNARISIYKDGTVIIPNGNLTDQSALQVFTDVNLGGTSKTLAIQTYHNNLAEFNNAIKSFKLKRGYMATLANNPDGTGYSRVFIANDEDLIINNLPNELNAKVSFIRVFRWDWVSKKGKAGWSPAKLNATWYYDWNIAGGSSTDYKYEAIRQNAGWPSWESINTKSDVTHLLGFNEPDQADQSNMTVEEAIRQWPDMMKSGLRIGSPAPAVHTRDWLPNFMKKVDSLNYRVDFIAVHCYWGGKSPASWYSDLKAIYDRYKRPIWITEWNNGANWTTETWPADQTAQFQKQYEDIKGILNVLDTASFVERYAIYDWVQDKRAMVLADTLTLAGKYYAANRSDIAYNPQKAFVHDWKLSAPYIFSAIKSDNFAKVILRWNDINGELGSKYVLERKVDGTDANFIPIQEFTGYAASSQMTYEDDVFDKASYRLAAYDNDGINLVYSVLHDVVKDAVPLAPTPFSGEIIFSSKLKLTWSASTSARSYNLKRSLNSAGPFNTISASTTALTYLDENLTPNTDYYYVVTSLNTAGESVASTTVHLKTPVLAVPMGADNLRIASGDTKLTLTWDFQYDTKYDILRSTTANGTYTAIATNVDAVRYEDNGTQNGTAYHYKVVAHNDAGASSESAVLSGTPVRGQHLSISFNENLGTKVYDVWGGYHGTLTNSPTWASGKEAGSSAVTLVKSASSYVQLPQGIVSTLSDFTVATWVKLPANQGTNTRIFDFGSGTGTFMVLIPRQSTTAMRYKITCPAGTYQQDIPYVLPLDQWVHVAVSQQGTQLKVYVNGQEIFTDNTATVKPSDMGFTTQNYLGRSQWPSDPYSDHTYDDFRIYNNALSLNEIQGLANVSVLPVTLNNFTAKKQNNSEVLLKWETLSETNSHSFIIERSTDGLNFVSIGEQLAKGNATSLNSYSFVDRRPANGNNYYRLKQVDINNDFDYSAVEQVKMAIDNRNLQVYPNPASSYVHLFGLESNKIHSYALFNILGLKVASGKVLNARIDLPQLPNAVYTLQIFEVDKNIANHKIIIRR